MVSLPHLDQLTRRQFAPPPGLPAVDFTAPLGAPALFTPDSVTWRVMKNPISLTIGGVAAVILELAEPRVRTGVWEHTSFRRDPAGRIRRTGYAAMATMYAPAESAKRLIAAVSRRHAAVSGTTPAGAPYRADDPELLTWVNATAAFGFLEAYRRFVRPLPAEACDHYYAEGAAAAALYGAEARGSVREIEDLFAAMRPKLERSDIIFEFLEIMRNAPLGPAAGRPLQRLAIRGAVEITPTWAREILGLDKRFGLPPGGAMVLRLLGAASDMIAVKDAPPAQASVRLGLKADYLYR